MNFSSIPCPYTTFRFHEATSTPETRAFFENFLELPQLIKVFVFQYLSFEDILAWREVTLGYKGIKDARILLDKYHPNLIDSDELNNLDERVHKFYLMSNVLGSNDVWREVPKRFGYIPKESVEGRICIETINEVKKIICDVCRMRRHPEFITGILIHSFIFKTVHLSDESIALLRMFRKVTQDNDYLIVYSSILNSALESVPMDPETRQEVENTWEGIEEALYSPNSDYIKKSIRAQNMETWMAEHTELLSQITTLDLRGLKITFMPNTLVLLKGLSSLDLEENYIFELPSNIGELFHLEKLYFSDNDFDFDTTVRDRIGLTLPENFTNLVNLTSFSIYHLSLKNLPENFGELTNLVELDLGLNHLRSLPSSFTKLTNLESLNLPSNDLNVPPPGMSKLVRLRSLNLDYNESLVDSEWTSALPWV